MRPGDKIIVDGTPAKLLEPLGDTGSMAHIEWENGLEDWVLIDDIEPEREGGS